MLYTVYILRSSFVHCSENRASDLGIKNVEFDKGFCGIFLKCVNGIKEKSLIDINEFCESKFPYPDFIIIHICSNDIKFACSKKLFSKF